MPPKALIPQNIVSVNPLEWVWKEGECVGLTVNVEVNYGERGLMHKIDIWPELTSQQRQQAVNIYNFIRARIVDAFIGPEQEGE